MPTFILFITKRNGGAKTRGLLVRIGADQSCAGGRFNGPADSKTKEFTYVPIPEDREIRPGMEKSYGLVSPTRSRCSVQLPADLRQRNMHLDPDFEHLTYGDENNKGRRIYKMWEDEKGLDFLVFYAGLKDSNPANKRLVYAIIGFYMIDEIVYATYVPPSRYDENAHTRRAQIGEDEIVVRAKHGQSGRLRKYLPIGSYRSCSKEPDGCLQYRVESDLLKKWGDLYVKDGWIQRGACLHEFKNADRFSKWFKPYKKYLVEQNN